MEESMSECQHPNFFFKEFKFYCRICGKEMKDDFQEKHRDKSYNITHCIHCGRKGFKDFSDVLDHVRRECKKRKM